MAWIRIGEYSDRELKGHHVFYTERQLSDGALAALIASTMVDLENNGQKDVGVIDALRHLSDGLAFNFADAERYLTYDRDEGGDGCINDALEKIRAGDRSAVPDFSQYQNVVKYFDPTDPNIPVYGQMTLDQKAFADASFESGLRLGIRAFGSFLTATAFGDLSEEARKRLELVTGVVHDQEDALLATLLKTQKDIVNQMESTAAAKPGLRVVKSDE